LLPHYPAPTRIRTTPPDVLVFIDGEEIGRAVEGSLNAQIDPGDHRLEARRLSYVTEIRDISIEAATVNELEVVLFEEQDMVQESSGGIHPATWALGGSSLAFLTAGTVFGTLALDRAEQERTYDLRAPGATREATDQLAEQADNFALAANICFVAGGALAVAAIVTFFVLDRDVEQGIDDRSRVSFGTMGWGGQVGIRF
jgi:hypothetical protein